MSETAPLLQNESVRFEETDFSARAIRWFVAGLIGLLVFTGAICAGLLWVFFVLTPRVDTLLPSLPEARSEMPLLQTEPDADLQRLRSRSESFLNSYGWVDRKNGIIHIPIEDAMRILVDRGMPPTMRVPDSPQIPPVKSKPSLPPPVSQRAADEFGDNR
ncbi:MAG: hypothetical protein IT169_13350 [Bryobacterales bacterium]|nr:hypothetical protein [Bryobacterales bacterium]